MKTAFLTLQVSNKKSSLLILLLVLSLNVFSQIDKGRYIVGGYGAFNKYKYYSRKTSTLSLSPSVGYFFLNRLAGGLRFGYDAAFYSFQTGVKSRERFISVAPYYMGFV